MVQSTGINRYFFEISNEFHNELVSLHGFVLPTATALWNFRGVITEELQKVPTPTVGELSKKFNFAPQTRGTTNLVQPFRDVSWEAQRERLAEVALVNIIALYESWCEEICSLLGRADLAVKLQFPTNATQTSGVIFGLNSIIDGYSGPVRVSIYPSLCKTKKYSLANLDNLLKCFRYFKELRNCFMHKGRRCDGKLWGAQSTFVAIANETDLGIGFVPEYSVVRSGDRINLSLHGVLGFTDVILRMVSTIDAELSKAFLSETVLLERMKNATTTPFASSSLRSIFNTMGIQDVTVTPELIAMLRSKNIVR